MATKIAHQVFPIIFLDANTLLCYKRGNIIRFNIKTNNSNVICKMPLDDLRKVLSYSDIATRRFGLNAIKGQMIDEKSVLIAFRHKIYVLNLVDNKLREIPFDKLAGANGNALSFTNTSYGVLWGDYGYNPQKESVGIYKMDGTSLEVSRLFTFPKGSINHIHRIVEDKTTHRFWIFTGDFGDSAAIYYSDDYFKSVHKFVSGDQKYRACLGYSVDNCLYYVSDSPDEDCNGVYMIDDNSCKLLHKTRGSVIYGVYERDSFIFSSTVENQSIEHENTKNNWKYNLGKGIQDWNIELSKYNIRTQEYKTLLTCKKDILPMMPFLYGCFRFPANTSSKTICFGQAITRFDQWLLLVE